MKALAADVQAFLSDDSAWGKDDDWYVDSPDADTDGLMKASPDQQVEIFDWEIRFQAIGKEPDDKALFSRIPRFARAFKIWREERDTVMFVVTMKREEAKNFRECCSDYPWKIVAGPKES